MSAETDAVLSDYLQAAGYRLTVWHVRCVESFLAAEVERPISREERLVSDLRFDVDQLHLQAQWEDAEWMARRSRWRVAGEART